MTLQERLASTEAESAALFASLRRLEHQRSALGQQIQAHEIESIRLDGQASLLRTLVADEAKKGEP